MRPIIIAAFGAALLASAPLVHADPFPGANIAKGKEYHEKLCVECHTRRFGGEEGSGAYLRNPRRANNPDGLKQMLSACTAMLNLDLFPEDEHDIAGYLNRRFYRFGLN